MVQIYGLNISIADATICIVIKRDLLTVSCIELQIRGVEVDPRYRAAMPHRELWIILIFGVF